MSNDHPLPAHITVAPASTSPASQRSPLTLLQAILANPADLAHVKQCTGDDFTYVSLNYANPELKAIMPWAGTNRGTEALVQTFIDVSRYGTVDEGLHRREPLRDRR
jgi:hypothetical protein